VWVLVFVFALAVPISSQSSGDSYEPYKPEEFPDWAHGLRRFETIFFGSIPISFLLSSIGFDLYAYAANDFDSAYLPLFFSTSGQKEVYKQETVAARIGVSISLSLVIALVDYFIEERKTGRTGE